MIPLRIRPSRSTPISTKGPWPAASGLDYYGGATYDAPVNYWICHTLADILTGLIGKGFVIEVFEEFEYSVGCWQVFENAGGSDAVVLPAAGTPQRRGGVLTLVAERLSDRPIIRPHMDDRMGVNINGPSVIRAPAWLTEPLGRYYLYFADHKGTYIRLATADAIAGPWATYRQGVLDVADSLFEPEDPPEPPEHERPPWAKKMRGGYLYAHVASPDVHVDHATRTVRMYYHGLLRNGDQRTRLAVSGDGLSFHPEPPLLGPPYLRAFPYGGKTYALTWTGQVWCADDWTGPFEPGPRILPYDVKEGVGEGFRHGCVVLRGDSLHIFFTRIGDRPERILHAVVDLRPDWRRWEVGVPQSLLEPELSWEGGDLALEASVMGAVDGPVRQLRDPLRVRGRRWPLLSVLRGGG